MHVLRKSVWTVSTARRLRKAGNTAEAALWNALKARQLAGHKFVRQFPIGPYFADFAHRQQKLVIELDGSQHSKRVSDIHRDAFMNGVGFGVLRFWSSDVLRDRDTVCATILAVLEGRMETTVSMEVKYLPAVPLRHRFAMPPPPQAGED